MNATLSIPLDALTPDDKQELAGQLIDSLAAGKEGMVRIDGKYGPMYLYRPPANGAENARRVAESLTPVERAELRARVERARQGVGSFSIDEVESFIAELPEDDPSKPGS